MPSIAASGNVQMQCNRKSVYSSYKTKDGQRKLPTLIKQHSSGFKVKISQQTLPSSVGNSMF